MLYVILAYLVLHIFVFTTYAPTPKASETVMWLAATQWFIPFFLLILLVPKVNRLLEPLARRCNWTVVGLVLALACIVMQILGQSGLWWAWSTMGLLTLVVITVARANVHMGQANALLLGVMAMLLGMASWEAIYQTGLLFYHDFFGSGVINYWIVIAEQLTWVLPALIAMLVLYLRYGHYIRFNTTVAFSLVASIVCTFVWFANGMEIPLYWWKGTGPYVNFGVNRAMISMSRGSQSFWLLSIALLFRSPSASVVTFTGSKRQGMSLSSAASALRVLKEIKR